MAFSEFPVKTRKFPCSEGISSLPDAARDGNRQLHREVGYLPAAVFFGVFNQAANPLVFRLYHQVAGNAQFNLR